MTRWIIGIVGTAAVAIVAIVIVAGGGDDGGADASTTPAVDSEQTESFQACLSEQGVDESTMPMGPGGVTPGADGAPSDGDQFQPPSDGGMPQPSEEMQEAMEACQDLMPTPPGGAPGTGGPEVSGAPPQE